MTKHSIEFKSSARKNLALPELRENLRRATHHSLASRREAVAQLPEWEDLRTAAHDIKREAIDHLASYLEQFERQATQAGCKVHWAQTDAQAIDTIIKICRERGASFAVKAKSMTSEELGLNEALNRAGVEPIETDLGEYIVQLAGETPSHITAPALHKSRAQIGRLFADKLGVPYTDDPQKLTQMARSILREKFLNSTVGITGVNFAATDTGTMVLITNEGNGRMCTSLPKTHIAIMGIEKVIPRFDDLRVFLKLLARSSTGQKLTSYVTMITGPRRPWDADGPEELHLVLLDNGRSRFLAQPHLREALLCIRCGACLNVCPVYERVGGHTYGWVYPGPIGSVLTPEFLGLQAGKELPYASSLCGSCSAVCPVKIDIHHMLLWQRHSIVQSSLSPWTERWAMKFFALIMKRPGRYRWSGAMGRVAQRLLARRGKGLRVPSWSEERDFPPLARQSFHDLWDKGEV